MVDASNIVTSLTLLERLVPRNPRDQEAWRTFLNRYGPLIAGWCRRWGLADADAEEVRAAVLARLAADQIGQFDPSRRFRPWLKAVVGNKVRDLLRQRKRRPGDHGSGDPAVQDQLSQLAVSDPVEELAGELEANWRRDLEQLRRITEMVRTRVRPDHWQAFWLRVIDGLPAEEVAARLNLTVATVHVVKYRVSQQLRQEAEKVLTGPRGGGR
jgi:RNA polymerase sigma-70 factor (ECF subfamily)